MYTSGTTGQAKGAVSTYGSVLFHAVNVGNWAGICRDASYLCLLPMFHIGGLYALTSPVLHVGGTVVVAHRFDAGETLRHIDDPALCISHIGGVPTHYLSLAQHPDFFRTDVSRVRFAGIGGAPAPLSLLREWEMRGIALVQMYGSTELLGAITLDQEDASRKVGSTGKPLLHVAVRVVDVDGRDVAPDEIGEIWVKGPSVGVSESARASLQVYHCCRELACAWPRWAYLELS